MSHDCIVIRDDYASEYMRIFRGGKNLIVPRLLCAITYNLPYDGDWVARHTCDNRACVRVEHVVPGSYADNAHDRDTRQRTATGLRHGRAVLSDEQVAAIRADTRSQQKIAETFNISRSTVAMIKTGARR
jgi:DNA-binding transcriptional regulator YiaG